MSTLRDNWLPNFVFYLLGLHLVKRLLSRWARHAFTRYIRPAFGQLYLRVLQLARRPMDLTPGALPPGTASATLTALQPLAAGFPSHVPQFVTTNSTWMLEEFNRQQRIARVARGF